jgi:hypothetical protein
MGDGKISSDGRLKRGVLQGYIAATQVARTRTAAIDVQARPISNNQVLILGTLPQNLTRIAAVAAICPVRRSGNQTLSIPPPQAASAFASMLVPALAPVAQV